MRMEITSPFDNRNIFLYNMPPHDYEASDTWNYLLTKDAPNHKMKRPNKTARYTNAIKS